MKFGIMEIDVKLNEMMFFSTISKEKELYDAFCQEGKRIYELLYKETGELDFYREDKLVKTEDDFYVAILYEYMVSELTSQNQKLKNDYENNKKYWLEKKHYFGMWGNRGFLISYEDSLKPKPTTPPEPLHPVIQEALNPTPKSQVHCPYCNSTRVEKIGSVSRAVSIFTLGLASGKIGKQWHCKDCKSDF